MNFEQPPTSNQESIKSIPEIPNSIIAILEECHEAYEYFDDEQLSKLGENLSQYLQQASSKEEWDKMMESFLDRFYKYFSHDGEMRDIQERDLLSKALQHLTLKQKQE